MGQNGPISLDTPDLGVRRADDARWLLVERVLASPAFQKSGRLRDLLRYLADQSLLGQASELTEQRIGQAVFGKPANYSPTEDSSVRVLVRQLRLKLHEYFDSAGRNEPLILEIPKGAYAPVFRPLPASVVEMPASAIRQPRPFPIGAALHWLLTASAIALCVFLWTRNPGVVSPPTPWPLSTIFNNGRTQIVVADANYSMLRILNQKSATLEEYLKPDFRQTFSTLPHLTDREARIVKYIDRSVLTSYADAAVLTTILNLIGEGRDRISVRSAKDLRLRDLQDGNFVFLGSPTSNPWTSMLESRLNFQEVQPAAGAGKHFLNKNPQPGEQNVYEGLPGTGANGEDYATISLLPTETGRGNILLFQGLQQEATEAAGLFLADEGNRQQLKKALNVGDVATQPPVYFETLLRLKAVAGSPGSISVVATRRLP